MRRLTLLLFAGLVCCRGAAPQNRQAGDITGLVDSLRPAVERATRLTFKGPTRSSMKTRDEVRSFLFEKLQQEFPADRQEGVEGAYRLLGLLPDTLNLKKLLLDLYTEQVVGYYDPETSTLYAVRGAEPVMLRVVIAHELVHALQHQYLPLDSLLKKHADSDEQAAAQAVLEGHAMLGGLLALAPDPDALRRPEFWSIIRDQVRSSATSMPEFSKAPQVLREGMVFPYLNGAEWVRWWDSAHAGHPLPSLAEMPRSTEQVLHPDRYAKGDQPVALRFDDSEPSLYEDTFGEEEIAVLATVLRGGGEALADAALGWGGDRFRIYRTPAGPALVWYLGWDDELAAARFMGGPGDRLARHERAGYRTEVKRVTGTTHPTVRVVIAPSGWQRWAKLPAMHP